MQSLVPATAEDTGDEYFGPGVRAFLEDNLPLPLHRVFFGGPVRTLEQARRYVASAEDACHKHPSLLE
ncbi:MAG: hypothetical protein A2731_04055 [Candidatus Buchananbacteria bacterium RIFCSPHIGHO2_01_FULL_39_8]|uniref:Uncharacterized protein n=1 Tax=Candidatus Buchananbacteria bacterium RIFCSPHIGHO2_01_FULL_39_8 TaxID=1797533 RepID=A0A1G1XYH5_9BACT|nr:MAG: hypothetical protein A2731_04055 [Candidatus Buchananbacteria bacterium RIFCSPHIGHO2_01_FULL_39_8]